MAALMLMRIGFVYGGEVISFEGLENWSNVVPVESVINNDGVLALPHYSCAMQQLLMIR